MMSDFVIKNGILKKYKGKEQIIVIPNNVKNIGGMHSNGIQI